MFRLLAVAVGSMAASTWLVGRIMPWLRAMSPRVIPSGAGVAIVVVVVVVAAALGIGDLPLGWRLAGGLVPAVGVAAMSLRDDFWPLSALVRLAGHITAAIGVVAALGPIDSVALGPLGSVNLGSLAWPLTILWIVGMTNVFNFMDGIDGITGITAAAAAAAVSAAAALLGSPLIAMIGIALAAGCLGFLVWNWPPGKVFMGDVGSTFCGFVVATLPLLLPGNQRIVVLPVAVMACWAFIFDAGYTLIRRLLCGENILHSHTTHLNQRLVAMGWSHRGVATLYGGLASISAAVAISPLLDPAFQPAAEALAPAAILAGITLLLALPSRKPESRASEIRA